MVAEAEAAQVVPLAAREDAVSVRLLVNEPAPDAVLARMAIKL